MESLDIQKKVVDQFERLYEANKFKLETISHKDACLLAFISGAQYAIDLVKEVEGFSIDRVKEVLG